MITEEAYREALSRLSGTDLRQAVRQVNDALKKLEQFAGNQSEINRLVERAAASNRAIKKQSTYEQFYLDKLATARLKRLTSPTGRRNAVQYLLLFDRECQVRLRCMPNGNGYDVYRTETDSFIIDGSAQTDAVVYDMFYWRTNRDDIGIAKLQLSDGWQQAELVYHYRSIGPGRERAFLKGPAYWRGASNLYLHLQDVARPDDKTGLTHVFLSLYVPEPADKRQYIAGVFASSNRDTHDPVSGMVLLQRNDTNPVLEQSDFIRSGEPDQAERVIHGIPDNVFYAVSNTRLKVSPRPILASLQIPYTQEISQLTAFAGTYQAYQPQPADCLRLMKLVIEPGGRVVLTRNNDTETGYVDYCADVLMLKFDFQPETASYRFYLILEKAITQGDMTGIYAGLDNESIVSTRLYLQRLSAEQTAQLHEQSHVNRAFLAKLSASSPAAVSFLTDSRLTTTDAFWTYRLSRLATANLKPVRRTPSTLPTGNYNAFFLSAIPDRDGSVDRVKLICVPLMVRENDVTAHYDGRIIPGYLTLNDEDQLTIQLSDPMIGYELTIDLPEATHGDPTGQSYARLSGTIRSESGSGALVLCRETDIDLLTYRTYEQLTDVLAIDRRYGGLASLLFDDWAQVANPTVQLLEPK